MSTEQVSAVTAQLSPNGQVRTESVRIKSGLRTTEFWVSIVAAIIPPILAIGFLSDDQVATVVAIASPIAAAFGYNISRGMAKL